MASPDSNGYFTNVIQLGYWPQQYQQNNYTTNPLTYQPNPLLTWSGLSENPPNSNSSSDYPLTPYPTSLNNNAGTQYGCCYDIWSSGNYYYMQWGIVGEGAIGLANSLYKNNTVSCCCAVLENKDPNNCQNPSSHTQYCNTDCCTVIAESSTTTNSYNDTTEYIGCQNYRANGSS